MRLSLIFILLMIVTVGTSSYAQRNSVDKKSAEELQLTIKLEKVVYRLEDPITYWLSLNNVSNKNLVINERGLVSHRLQSHEIYFLITDQKGTTYEYLPIDNSSAINTYYKVLPSGESLSGKSILLLEEYGITQPGNYTIQAIYENKDDAPAKLRLLSAWKGSVESNKITFRIGQP